MHIKHKFLMIFTFGLLSVVLIFTKVYASNDSCELTITPDKTQVNSDEKITLVLMVSNITSKNGIAIYNGLIDYDSDVFEISVQDSSDGKWKGDLIENSVTFTKADLEGTTEKQEIGRIVLKVKNGVYAGKQTITMKNNEFADVGSFKIAEVSTNVEIIENNNSNNNSIYDDSENSNSKNSTFIVEQDDIQTNSDNAMTNNSAMQTSQLFNAGKIIIILVIIAIVIGVYLFNKNRKIKMKH